MRKEYFIFFQVPEQSSNAQFTAFPLVSLAYRGYFEVLQGYARNYSNANPVSCFIMQKKKGKFQHSSFLAGGATSAAGRLVVENGLLKVCI